MIKARSSINPRLDEAPARNTLMVVQHPFSPYIQVIVPMQYLTLDPETANKQAVVDGLTEMKTALSQLIDKLTFDELFYVD